MRQSPAGVPTGTAADPAATSGRSVVGSRFPALRNRPAAWARQAGLFLAYLALALAALGANPFKGQSITPLDYLVRQHAFAWAELEPGPRFGERSDVLNGLLPPWIDARRQLREGRLPLWNDGLAGGATHLAPNFSTFTPAFAVFAAAPTAALGFHLAIALNLAIAGWGMHLFLRRHVGRVAAVAGAVTFMFCGFHAAWLYWAHVHTMIWAPWLLLAIERCIERPGMRAAVGIAAATIMVVLGGFPFVAEMILCAGGLYAVVAWMYRFGERQLRWQLPVWYAAGSMLGLLACTPLLLELAAWLQQYDLGYRQNRGSYLRLEHVSRLLPPWSYEYKRVEQTMYVGAAMTLLALCTTLASIASPRRIGRLQAFALALLVIVGGLVFGLWPMWMVGWFPGMSFNAWSRAIGVMDLALIVLGVLAIERLCRWAAARSIPRRGQFAKGAILLLVLVQAAEQTHFFRRYNGPAPASYFFPDLPTIDYVRDRAGPFDYVVADASFGIAGELGAYDLRDWFAHWQRTPAHRAALAEMVPKHRRSHTASRFRAGDIRTGSQTLADFNNRFLILRGDDDRTVGPAREPGGTREAMPPQPGAAWTQYFDVDATGLLLRGISVRMATYQARSVRGTVELTLHSGGGARLAGSRIDARTVMDNELVEFHFPQPVELTQGRHRFTLQYSPDDRAPTRPLTAWALSRAGDTTPPLLAGDRTIPAELEYLLHVGEHVRGRYRRVYAAAGMAVFESTSTPNGPYFLSGLDEPATSSAGDTVDVLQYRPEAFALQYSGQRPGYVVVPQILTRDWTVTVEGQVVAPVLKSGVMPAVPVKGPARIEFRYSPWNGTALLAWAIGLLGLLGAMGYLNRRSVRRSVVAERHHQA